MRKSLFIILAIGLLVSSCGHNGKGPRQTSLPENLTEAIDSPLRDSANVERDEFQKPLQTLVYFGIKPTMSVVEVYPGPGYYTEILAPYLARVGHYALVVPRMPPRPPRFMVQNEKKLQDILLQNPEVQAKSRFIPFEPISKRNEVKPASVDLVLSFSSVHNWVASKSETMAFKLFYDILRPGGVLGIVQHRIPEGKPNQPRSGYMTEAQVISMARAAGFKLVGKSELNANPKDTHDHPGGVWTLPPTFRLGDLNRSKYEDIGESDKMTLKFMK